MKEIKVIVARDGSTATVEVMGVKGPSCESLTKAMTDALGMVEESKKTPEYYLQDLSVVHNGR